MAKWSFAFTKRKFKDKFTIFAAVISSVVCLFADMFSVKLTGYKFGFEILILNGLITFILIIAAGLKPIKNYEKEIYLYRFFIDEKYRNNGIGTIALNQIIELARFENKDLSLEVIGENIARDLYERLGFKTHYRRMILKINDDIYEN